MKKILCKFYFWILSEIKRTNMSTKEDLYFEIDNKSLDLFRKLKTYLNLLNEGERKHYLKFSIENENSCEFLIGHRRLVLRYFIDLKEFKAIFTTDELIKNPENYEVIMVKNISTLIFVLKHDAELFFAENKEQGLSPSKKIHDFPIDYLREVEKCFETI